MLVLGVHHNDLPNDDIYRYIVEYYIYTYCARLLCPWNSPGKNTEVGSCSLLQGIFPVQGSNLNFLHLQADSLPSELPGKSSYMLAICICCEMVIQ